MATQKKSQLKIQTNQTSVVVYTSRGRICYYWVMSCKNKNERKNIANKKKKSNLKQFKFLIWFFLLENNNCCSSKRSRFFLFTKLRKPHVCMCVCVCLMLSFSISSIVNCTIFYDHHQ